MPPVLQVNLNRFDIDNEGNFVKVNSKCEFSEVLNLDNVIQQTDSFILSQNNSPALSQDKRGLGNEPQNLYHLHSILIHHGTLDHGHYYAYIRPSATEDKWYKFNDMNVTPCLKTTAFLTGQGGFTSSFKMTPPVT